MQSQVINRVHLDSLLKNGKNFTALKHLNSIDTLRLKKQDLAAFHFYKAKCFEAENKNPESFLSYLRAKKDFLEIDSLDSAMAINLDIAFLLSTEKNNRKKAETYIKDYLNYALEKKNNLLIAMAYSSWGIWKMEEEPLQSLKLFKKAELFGKKAQNFDQLENLYSSFGVLYNEMLQKPDSALYYIDKSLFYAKKNNNKNGICVSLINKAGCYYSKKEYGKAIELLKEADAIALPENSENIKSFILVFLSLNYNEIEDYQKAYDYLSESVELTAAFNFADQNTKISEFNIKYETKEKEIENLKLKARVKQNRIIIFAALGLLLVGVILTILVFNNLSKKKKIAEQSQLIHKQQLDKTLKNRELHDIDIMLQSQEQERQQIANELHDNLGSLLATLKLNFQNLSRSQGLGDNILFEKTDALLEETYQKVRNIAHLKNLGVKGSEGLLVAVKKMSDKMSVINRLKFEVIPFGLGQRLSNSTEITLFRMIQELCTNIIKHSKADEVNIYLTQHNSDSINVIIEDNGRGFVFKNITKTDGIGLKNIEQKVEQMGGTFTVDSVLSKGTTIIIDIPL